MAEYFILFLMQNNPAFWACLKIELLMNGAVLPIVVMLKGVLAYMAKIELMIRI